MDIVIGISVLVAYVLLGLLMLSDVVNSIIE
jgi:hypothetical protein